MDLHRVLSVPSRGSLVAAIALVVTVALVGACGGKSDSQLAIDELNLGLAAQSAGDLGGASTHYLACLKYDANNTACLYDLGLIAQIQGRAGEAENYYRLALAHDPNYSSALFNLAILRASLKDAPGAIALYRQYLTVRPEDPNGHLNLAVLLQQTGDTAGAASEAAIALKLDPKIALPTGMPSAKPSAPAASETPAAASPSVAPSATSGDGTGGSPSPSPSSSASRTYTVKTGDTLSRIATRYGTTVDALRALNGMSSSTPLTVGLVLRLP